MSPFNAELSSHKSCSRGKLFCHFQPFVDCGATRSRIGFFFFSAQWFPERCRRRCSCQKALRWSQITHGRTTAETFCLALNAVFIFRKVSGWLECPGGVQEQAWRARRPHLSNRGGTINTLVGRKTVAGGETAHLTVTLFTSCQNLHSCVCSRWRAPSTAYRLLFFYMGAQVRG